MLDRLREFAPDRTGGMLRRQIGRIANPWNLLPGRDEAEEPVPQEPAATAELKPLPQPVMTDPASLGTAELLRTLIDSLERELESWPQTESGSALQPDLYRRRQLNLRLLHLIDDQPAAAAEAIDLMSPQEQEFWQELILGISRFRNPDETIDYDQHIAATIGQLEQAVQQLQPLSSLSIRRVAFCSSINNFGSIEPFPSDTFEPGQRLLIYAEVDNLQSDISPLGTYRTSFSGTLQIVPVTAEEPERPMAWELPTENDDSTTRRADYFASYEFTLPAYLPPGQYEIRLSVHDEISERNATTRLPFSVQ